MTATTFPQALGFHPPLPFLTPPPPRPSSSSCAAPRRSGFARRPLSPAPEAAPRAGPVGAPHSHSHSLSSLTLAARPGRCTWSTTGWRPCPLPSGAPQPSLTPPSHSLVRPYFTPSATSVGQWAPFALPRSRGRRELFFLHRPPSFPSHLSPPPPPPPPPPLTRPPLQPGAGHRDPHPRRRPPPAPRLGLPAPPHTRPGHTPGPTPRPPPRPRPPPPHLRPPPRAALPVPHSKPAFTAAPPRLRSRPSLPSCRCPTLRCIFCLTCA